MPAHAPTPGRNFGSAGSVWCFFLLLALFLAPAMPAFGARVYTEQFTSNTLAGAASSGWIFTITNSNYRFTNGVARMRLQSGYSPTGVGMLAPTNASSGAFAGNYLASNLQAIGFSMIVTAAAPDVLLLQLSSGTNTITADLKSRISRTGEWFRLVTSLKSKELGLWTESSPGAFSNVLSNVTGLRIGVNQDAQSSLTEVYQVDDFFVAVDSALQGISPITNNFGAVLTGSVSQISILITNAGNLSLTGRAETAGAPFAIVGNQNYSLAAGATTNVILQFAPTQPGTFNQTVVFKSSGGTMGCVVQGSALVPPLLGVAPASVDYGTIIIGNSTTAVLVATNSGGAALTGSVTLVGANFTLISPTTFVLQASQATNISVLFSPLLGTNYTGSVVVASSAGTYTSLLAGAGYDGPIFGLTPTVHDFGVVPVYGSTSTIFVVTNGGPQTLTGLVTVGTSPFAVGGDGIFAVGPGATTSVVIRFEPLAPGSYSNLVLFESNVGTYTGLVVGVGSNMPIMEVTPASVDFGDVGIGMTNSTTIIISNHGAAPLSGAASAPQPPFTVDQTDFTSLEPEDSFLITLSFSPGAAGSYSNTLVVAPSDDRLPKVNIPIKGRGAIPPVLQVTPASIALGPVPTGDTARTTFTVSNTGGLPLSGTCTVSGASFELQDGAAFELAAGGTTNIDVLFTPLAVQGYTGTVVFTSDGGIRTGVVTGAGITTPLLGISPSSLNYGTVPVMGGSSAVFVVTNRGLQTLTGSVSATGAPFTVERGSTFTIPARGWTSAVVRFAPTAPGTYSSNLVFQSNGGSLTGHVSGIASNLPILSVNPTSYYFGVVATGQYRDVDITISNSGMANLSGNLSLSGATFQILSATNFAALTPGQTQTVTLRFAPSDLIFKPYSNRLVITSDGGVYSLPLTGVGVRPATQVVTPNFIDLGAFNTGETVIAEFEVVNVGGFALTSAVSAAGGPFSIVQGSNIVLPPDGITNVWIQFAPVAGGTYEGEVVMAGNGGTFTGRIAATANDGAWLSVDPAAYDFGSVAVNGSSSTVFTILNRGVQTLTGFAVVVGDAYSIQGPAAFVVEPGATTGVVVRTDPAVEGPYPGTIEISSNGGSFTGALNTAAVNLPILTVDPVAYNFAMVPLGQVRFTTITVSNRGAAALTGLVSMAGTNFTLTSGAGAFALEGGATTSITVRFAPTLAQSFSNDLVITSNDRGQRVPLTGAGGLIDVTPLEADYGYIALYGETSTVFQVLNLGGVQLTGIVTLSSADLSTPSGSTFRLDGGFATNITLHFSPSTEGRFTGEVVFASNAGVLTGRISAVVYLPTAGSTNSFCALTNGWVTVAFGVSSGAWYHIEASTNLLDPAGWFVIGETNRATSGTLMYQGVAPEDAGRFYRLLSP